MGKRPVASQNGNEKIEDKGRKGTNDRTRKGAKMSTGPFRMG